MEEIADSSVLRFIVLWRVQLIFDFILRILMKYITIIRIYIIITHIFLTR